jgi:hypothetical protein
MNILIICKDLCDGDSSVECVETLFTWEATRESTGLVVETKGMETLGDTRFDIPNGALRKIRIKKSIATGSSCSCEH